ncbi:hypothetical protein U1Q18_007996 [Sarracenia purpurea var. burkii]
MHQTKAVKAVATPPDCLSHLNLQMFRATRKKLLDDNVSRVIKKRVGFKSAMLVDVKPSADGQETEKDFRTKYCRAEYLHSTKNTIAATAEAAEDEELAVFLKQDDI